ncbi:hypothetical protein [Geobacillus subterraneus]
MLARVPQRTFPVQPTPDRFSKVLARLAGKLLFAPYRPNAAVPAPVCF